MANIPNHRLIRKKDTGDTTDNRFEALTAITTSETLRDAELQRVVNTGSPSAILTADGYILFDSSSTAISISLPAASEVGKITIPFKDIGANSAANNITINRVGSDTIVDSAIGQTSTVIASNGFSGFFLSDGVDTWYLM
jgi:hypothetical protein